MKRRCPGRLVAILFVLSLGFSVPMAGAATFTVDRFDDANGPCTPGDCSLREALLAAETTPEADTVLVPEGRHTLSLPETSPGSLAGGDLEILLFDVEIVAPDGAIVDAQGIDRVFRFLFSDSRIEGLTITGGSVPLGLGGGVYSESSQLELSRVWIVDNEANTGGGLAIELGTVIVADSTISGNTADASGGGVYLFGISFTRVGRLEVYNSTISGNHAQFAGGAIERASAGELLLEYSTIANNTNRPGDPTIFAFLLNVRANAVQTLIEGTCTAGPQTSCIYQSSKSDELPVLDLGLEPLANGGPTPTHRLLPSSPAVDLVPVGASCPSTDQRGVDRPEDGDGDGEAAFDAGAYELVVTPSVVEIPTLDLLGKLVFGLVLATIAVLATRR